MSPSNFKTIIEPFKIKVAEPIRMLTTEARLQILQQAKFNLFKIPAEDVTIDLLTDSGTAAMSSLQWARMMEGDESYAGSKSFFRFEKVVQTLTGFKHVIPTHQGRAAEHILFQVYGGAGKVIPNNTHFDTTRAHVENSGARAVDLSSEVNRDTQAIHPFKGNMNLEGLTRLLSDSPPGSVPLVMMTITNNSLGGQPVSMENIREVSKVCKKHSIPFYIDGCRFAENAFFIKMREAGYQNQSIEAIVGEMFSYCDGMTMSAKKDGLVNMGGFLALHDQNVALTMRNALILTEGFPTYGGLSGRDLEAMAQGLQEVIAEDYLEYRYRSTAYLGDHLIAMGIPILQPIGGHAIYLDADRFVPHIPKEQFPAQALAAQLYLVGGVRSVEIGSLMFGAAAKDRPELVRLAIPRRVYTQSHIDYVIEVIEKVWQQRTQIRGLKIIFETPVLRHFSADLALI